MISKTYHIYESKKVPQEGYLHHFGTSIWKIMDVRGRNEIPHLLKGQQRTGPHFENTFPTTKVVDNVWLVEGEWRTNALRGLDISMYPTPSDLPFWIFKVGSGKGILWSLTFKACDTTEQETPTTIPEGMTL